jgi:hypothetical protein
MFFLEPFSLSEGMIKVQVAQNSIMCSATKGRAGWAETIMEDFYHTQKVFIQK